VSFVNIPDGFFDEAICKYTFDPEARQPDCLSSELITTTATCRS